jgi:hypothetical protein
VSTSAAATLAGASAAAPAERSWIELHRFQLRNNADNQNQIMTEFLGKGLLPALKRAGAGPVGAFSSVIAEDSPFILMAVEFPSFAQIESMREKVNADSEYRKSVEAFYKKAAVPYVRMEASLLRSFETIPRMEVPKSEAGRSPRVFEMRVYESSTLATLQRKIKMFDEGEIAIFRKTGLLPVFFGAAVYGRNLPNLTYMLAFDDLAAREKNWRTFVSHPEWQKLRATPGLSDAEVVSNISNSILRPLAFSEIK